MNRHSKQVWFPLCVAESRHIPPVDIENIEKVGLCLIHHIHESWMVEENGHVYIIQFWSSYAIQPHSRYSELQYFNLDLFKLKHAQVVSISLMLLSF